MAKYNRLDALFRHFMTDAPTEAKLFSRSELLTAAGITSRQLTYYIQKGAVARPIGKTRAAKFTIDHLHQAQRVVELLKNHQTTVPEIAEAYASNTPGARAVKTPSLARDSSAVKLIKHPLTAGVCILVDDELLPTEKRLLAELLKVAKKFNQLRTKLALETITREQRLLDQVVPSKSRKKAARA
jgi:DNA-binding transcriptional MerR regulator